MTRISGSLLCVTSKPAAVSEVWVRAPRLRAASDAVITTDRERVPVDEGQVSFSCAAGPAVVVLVSAGAPVQSVPILVADTGEMSLQDAVKAAEAVSVGDRRVLEELAASAVRAVEAEKSATASALALQKAQEATARDAKAAALSAEAAKRSEESASESASEASRSVETVRSSAEVAQQHASEAQEAKERAEAAADRVGSAEQVLSARDEATQSAASASKDAGNAAESARGAASSAEAAAKSASEADTTAVAASVRAVEERVSKLLEGAPEAYDTLQEVAAKLSEQDDVASLLMSQLAGKAEKKHEHTLQDVKGLDAALSEKANKTHSHNFREVEGLQAALSEKLDSSRFRRETQNFATRSELRDKASSSEVNALRQQVTESWIAVGNTRATDGKLHVVYE